MLLLQIGVVILASLCVASEIEASSLGVISKTYNFTNKLLFVDSKSIDGLRFSYVVCNDNYSKSEINCRVNLVTDHKEKDKSCVLSIKSYKSDSEVAVSSIFIQLSGNSLIIQWTDKNEKSNEYVAHFRKVDLDTCHASLKHTPIGLKEENNPLVASLSRVVFHVVPYEKGHYLFFRNSELCGNKYCKITYSEDSDSKPVAWSPNANEEIIVTAVDRHSETKGLLMSKLDVLSNDVEVSLIQSNGTKILREGTVPSWRTYAWGLITSTSHNKIGICASDSSIVVASQYDLNGAEILQSLTIFDYDVYVLGLHNLPNGGFLLLTTACASHTDECPKGSDRYTLTKVDVEGNTVGTLNIADFTCLADNKGVHHQFFENETNKTCLSFVCLRKNNNSQSLDFFSKCFADGDFVKK